MYSKEMHNNYNKIVDRIYNNQIKPGIILLKNIYTNDNEETHLIPELNSIPNLGECNYNSYESASEYIKNIASLVDIDINQLYNIDYEFYTEEQYIYCLIVEYMLVLKYSYSKTEFIIIKTMKQIRKMIADILNKSIDIMNGLIQNPGKSLISVVVSNFNSITEYASYNQWISICVSLVDSDIIRFWIKYKYNTINYDFVDIPDEFIIVLKSSIISSLQNNIKLLFNCVQP